MSDQVTTTENTEVKVTNQENTADRYGDRNRSRLRQPRNNRSGNPRSNEKKDEFDNKIINIRRVNRMFKGGRRMRLSVFVVVGDKAGRVGIGIGKGDDVKSAQDKAVRMAKKKLIQLPLKGQTIPHEITYKYGSARIVLKPAAPGTGVVAGSSIRLVAEMAGIKDLLAKILGGNNKVTNAYATVYALSNLRSTRL